MVSCGSPCFRSLQLHDLSPAQGILICLWGWFSLWKWGLVAFPHPSTWVFICVWNRSTVALVFLSSREKHFCASPSQKSLLFCFVEASRNDFCVAST